MASESRAVQPSVLVQLLASAVRSRVLVVGDLMLDEYVAGPSDRLSPEAPVPVVRVEQHTSMPGGAAHVASVAARLGATVDVVGVLGRDESGATLRGRCERSGIGTGGLVDCSDRPTTRKVRVVSGPQQIVRLDHERAGPLSAEVRALVLGALRSATVADVIVVSDYAKGVLDDGVLGVVMDLARTWGAPVLVDPKHPDLGRYRGASLIKLNRDEFAVACRTDPDQPLANLLEHTPDAHMRSGADTVVVTLGPDGMAVSERGEPWCHVPAAAQDVFDVTGAGDVVAAVLALGMSAGLPMVAVAGLANVAAGLAVRRLGVQPVEPSELVGEVLSATGPAGLRTRDAVVDRVRAWKLAGERVVFTNGCFDLFHPGHLELLRRAALLGDRLVVAVDADPSVRRLKGEGRPVIDEAARTQIISAIDVVDEVVVFDGDLLELLDQLAPDVLVKGADYVDRPVVGRELVEARGGRVELVPLLEGHSTTSIVQRLGGAPAGSSAEAAS
jgi:D-beta-D-heptose 7-phosphate kinase/D-beta-D-heptose 1-phosphate adenosyltransferase